MGLFLFIFLILPKIVEKVEGKLDSNRKTRTNCPLVRGDWQIRQQKQAYRKRKTVSQKKKQQYREKFYDIAQQ